MHLNRILLHLSTLFLFATTSAFANNVTVSGVFDGTESSMAAAPGSCNNTAKHFRVAGSITVSTSGSYTVVDAGNWFESVLPQSYISDSVIMVYADNFDSNNPATNRVASVDEFEDVQLNTGISYTLVVQHWCNEINGAFAIVIEGGQKTITGEGFTSPSQTIGNFNDSSPSAYFANIDAVRRYRIDEKSIYVSGNYYFVDVGEETGGASMSLRIYQGAFDPLNTETNLYYNSDGFFTGVVSLRAGVTYVFVLVENAAATTHVQYVLYPPGPFNFNPGLNGAWVAQGITSQGILMEVLPISGTLFFAHFTFQDQVVVAASKAASSTPQSSAGGDPVTQAHIGADDQIWLTAYGSIPADGNVMTISYENSTGGQFNSETPVATRDSNYGTGFIEGLTCDHLIINWNLPGGVFDTRDYFKSTQDAVPYCENFIHAGAVRADW